MKENFLITIVVMFSMLVIPLSSLSDTKRVFVNVSGITDDVLYSQPDGETAFETIRVLKGDNIIELTAKDYIFGVVAAEMPALYDEEALKAQAVAAYTFACYRMKDPNAEYHITADANTAQCFITREEAKARWGEKADEYSKKIDNCIDAVRGELLVFDGVPICAAYHAISPGSTNACVDVWGKDLPYLKSVDSIGDQLADGYLSENIFTTDDIAVKLKSISTAQGEPQNYFSECVTTDSGYVKSITFCGNQTSGSQICKLLGLRSGNFTVAFSNNTFTFTVKGYGHGIGMSQTGADYMAKQGSSYEEILLHYYRGATLQKN